MKIDRAEVEALLATLEQVRKPNNGTLAKLCRLALEMMDAPVVKVRGKVGEVCMVPVSHDFCGSRVRLVRVGEE